MTEHIIKHEEALGFIFGGNALFTVRNPKTENRFTFKVTKHKKEDIFFVKVLTNPDVYEFIGSIRVGSKFKHSKRSRISDEAQSVKVFDFVLTKLITKSLPQISCSSSRCAGSLSWNSSTIIVLKRACSCARSGSLDFK